ncbi:imm11 family protein [Halocynthiibacter styelae]|uniref:Immunity MXAN-0049 protein domain-containing protein n=1 Tax=Halocynthiibacter styelae TaxID=2761955 RepID=A0A8J7IY98_9RHOB|nr:DUF1629 domain-containing protein [Paenihalocynthiibacter styelae]MBI1494440.1 hypothetical protein [Paenihalocynthiibacter styelae]
MPWKLDKIAWNAHTRNPLDLVYEPGQEDALFLIRRGKVPDEKHWPIRLLQTTKDKTRPDYTIGATTSDTLVSQRFRDLVEAKDPAQHIYVPVEIYAFKGEGKPRGELLNTDHFFFYPQEPLDGGLVIEESDLAWRRVNPKLESLTPTALHPRLMCVKAWLVNAICGQMPI